MRWFQNALTCLAFCWRLTRRDGVRLGFTSHDRDILVDGQLCRAAPGMVPSAIERSDGLDASSADVTGALSNDAISEADLLAGRWDGAQVRLLAVDWTAPDMDPLVLVDGETGSVDLRNGRFTTELKGAVARLDRPVCPETSPLCRARLGDGACRVDLAARQITAVLTAADGAHVSIGGAHEAGRFALGRLRWITGENSGLESAVLSSDGGELTLAEAPPAPAGPGTLVWLEEGCDGRLETCAGRFGNGLNFQGEPHLPGHDLLMRYAIP